jgi:hypothetical protein
MKRIIITTLALVLVFGLATAEAGQKKKVTRKSPPRGSRTEKTEEMKKPARYDKMPTMSYVSGRLDQEGLRGWRIGNHSLILKDDCSVMEGGEAGYLREGKKAIVMGSRVGDTIVAWSVRLVPEDFSSPTPSRHFRREPGPNPNVGVLKGNVE